jgi:hypothetical protein
VGGRWEGGERRILYTIFEGMRSDWTSWGYKIMRTEEALHMFVDWGKDGKIWRSFLLNLIPQATLCSLNSVWNRTVSSELAPKILLLESELPKLPHNGVILILCQMGLYKKNHFQLLGKVANN